MALKQINFAAHENLDETVILPLSKSIAARVAILRFLTDDVTEVPEWPDCDDTSELRNTLEVLGNAIRNGKNFVDLNLGSGGTSFRFFLALASSVPGMKSVLGCSPQLMKRPVGPLVDALRGLGARIEYKERYGYPPLSVMGDRLAGGPVNVEAGVSSQFVSALMMMAPFWRNGVSISLKGSPVSVPYIRMTSEVMERFGVKPEFEGNIIGIPARKYRAPRMLEIEADWSAASYMYEIALLMPGREIHIGSLTPPSKSMQGDSACCDIYGLLGVNTSFQPDGSAVLKADETVTSLFRNTARPIEFDMGNTPDLVPSLAVALCLSDIRFILHGISHLRHKESDRISALVAELEKFGYRLEAGNDSLAWTGGILPHDDEPVATYGDHRIAMAFAPVAVKRGFVSICDPEVVDKSFPSFWCEIKKLGLIDGEFYS